MSAEVKITLPRLEDVLTVPSEAVHAENGHEFCFVVRDDGLERREIKLGQVTADLAEVTQGLEEGEQVVVNATEDEIEQEESIVRADLPREESATKPAQQSRVVAALQ
jgi:multidrug efflux pump subunit AcrA (membrane-fusion protein)